MTRRTTVYDKPKPARVILSECGLSDDEAVEVLRALVRGGYGIAPRNPTNGMLAGYLEATEPPKHHEAVITAIGKARVRWQAMLAHGTAMALSRKYLPSQQSDATQITSISPCDENGETVVSISRAKGGHARAAKLSPERRREIAKKAAEARWERDGNAMTAEEIDAKRTPSGGWTRAQLAEWGVPWPPPKGWKARLTEEPAQAADSPPS